jgi:hypothetical protein
MSVEKFPSQNRVLNLHSPQSPHMRIHRLALTLSGLTSPNPKYRCSKTFHVHIRNRPRHSTHFSFHTLRQLDKWVAPKTGASLSCSTSFLRLLFWSSASPMQAIYNSHATEFQSRITAVRSVLNVVLQKSKWHECR